MDKFINLLLVFGILLCIAAIPIVLLMNYRSINLEHVAWSQINPPPGIEGPCYLARDWWEGPLGIWCSDRN